MLLYSRDTSGNCYKVRLLLIFLGRDFSVHHVELGPSGRNSVGPEYLRLNPRDQVPTLVDGDHVFWGSTACLCYVARKYDNSKKWLPEDAASLGTIMQWLELAQNEITTGIPYQKARSL